MAEATQSSDVPRDVDVLVIGGGQAGLAAGYYLNRLRRDEASGRSGPAPSFAILDANEEPGGAWQHYWESLELFSPAAYSSLPGYQMPAWRGTGNPSAGHVAQYLRTYEDRYDLPVHRAVRATAVQASAGGGYTTETSGGRWTSRAVINATGSWTTPCSPQLPGSGQFTGQQLHTADYRGPEPYAGRNVIVVGGGNSGAQIAADLASTSTVTWVTRRPPRYLPDDVDGRALFRIATSHVRALAAGKPSPGGVGSLGDIVAVPAVRAARDAGLLQVRPLFSRLVADGVQWDGRVQWDDGVQWDGRVQRDDDGGGQPGERAQLKAEVIIWCTGFSPDLQHLSDLGLTTRNGVPATETNPGSRSADRSGLFFLGYGDWCGPASATLIGVGAAARDTVAAAAGAAAACPGPKPS